MKATLLSISLFLSAFTLLAQTPEDVLRYSYFPQHGTARSMAIGGAMGSLGGDISALYVNPAGLGLYKTREIVLSPGLVLNSDKATYRDNQNKSNNSAFDLGTSGIVLGWKSRYGRNTSEAFSFGISQTANFNNVLSYSGTNNYSSYSEQFAEEIANSGLSVDQILNDPSFAYGSAPALYTYLVDTFTVGGGVSVKGLPEFLLADGIALDQQKTITTKGGIYELALGYGANTNERFYWGASIGLPIVSYDRYTQYRESDPSGNTNNNFDYFELNDRLTTRGVGINGKLGLIFKPAESVRLGITVHTPTYYSLTDRETSDLTTNTEGYNGTATAKSTDFTGGVGGRTLYTATTPWKAILSASYVLREVNDVRQQKGFITADIEYVGYPGANFKADGNDITSADQAYYTDLKNIITDYYKGGFNFRLGGELKFNTFMVRLGGAYYSTPYKDPALKSNIIQAGGGIGYRNHGIFVDLTYVQLINKDVNFPYRLVDKANTFANYTNNRGNVMLTFGFKI